VVDAEIWKQVKGLKKFQGRRFLTRLFSVTRQKAFMMKNSVSRNSRGYVAFFGYPIAWARVIFWSGRSPIVLAREGLSIFARTQVARPTAAQ
jgi:hypothetical protein